MSDWEVDQFSLEAWISDLETVVAAAGFKHFALIGELQDSCSRDNLRDPLP